MRTHDVSAQPKNGETLLQLVLDDIKWSEETYGHDVIAACSDDGGDACQIWCLLCVLLPWLIIILCWAHQINLIIGDYCTISINPSPCVTCDQLSELMVSSVWVMACDIPNFLSGMAKNLDPEHPI